MKLSVIIPTLGREKQVNDLLESLKEINNYKHEILIIDQNFNSLLDEIILKYQSIYNIIHYKVDFRSLSKAKNFGIEKASGQFICFPDDDSTLFRDTISKALDLLENNSHYDIVFGKCVDESGNDSVISFHKDPSELTLKNFEGKFIEATMFARTHILKENFFDENLGIGSFFGAEEGYDLIYRLLLMDYNLFYTPNIKFSHPQTLTFHGDISSLKRVYNYRKGYGYLCRKHKFYLKFAKRLVSVVGAIFFFLLLNFKKSKYYTVEACALIIGYLLNEKYD
jgi:glycosyltransferase involved in cell wall biosynthesis